MQIPEQRSAKPLRRGAAAGVLLSACLMTAGCGGPAPAAPHAAPSSSAPSSSAPTSPAAAAPAKALRPATMMLGWLVAGYDAGFYVAQAKGWYKDAGINLKIIPGKSSQLTAELVSEGKLTFGVSDAGTTAQLISKGAAIKELAVFTQKSPVGIMHMPNVPLKTAHDLQGKTIFANSSGGPVIELLRAVLNRAHMTMSDIHLNVVSPAAEATEFETHPADYALTFSYSAYPAVLLHVPKAAFTYYSDLGVNTLSDGLITTNQEIQAHPNLVRGFVHASIKGFQYAVKHQAKAIAIMTKEFPQENAFILRKSLANALTLLHTSASKGKPLGYMTSTDWRTTLSLLKQYAGMKVVKPLSDYYTNRFVPAS